MLCFFSNVINHGNLVCLLAKELKDLNGDKH